MTKSSLARVRWQVTLVEHEPAQTPGWKLVQDTRKLSDEVHEVELLLESPELQKADFEDFSKQEDKLKVSHRSNVTQHLIMILERRKSNNFAQRKVSALSTFASFLSGL